MRVNISGGRPPVDQLRAAHEDLCELAISLIGLLELIQAGEIDVRPLRVDVLREATTRKLDALEQQVERSLLMLSGSVN